MSTSKRDQELEQVRRLTDSHQQLLNALTVQALALAKLIRQMQGDKAPAAKRSQMKISR